MNTQIIQWGLPIISSIIALLIWIERKRATTDFDAKAKAIETRYEERAAARKMEVDRQTADVQADLQAMKERTKMLDFILEQRDNDIKRVESMLKVQDDAAKVVAANNATLSAFSKMVANYTASIDRNTEVTERLEATIDNFGKLVKGMWENVNKVSEQMIETGDQVVAAGKQIMNNSERIGGEIITRLEQLEKDLNAQLAAIKSDLDAQAVTLKDIDERIKLLEIKPEPVPPPAIELALKPITSVTIETEDKKTETTGDKPS